MLILHPKFPILPPISAKITRNHTEFFRFTECGMPDLRRKTEGALFKDYSQNHTKCDRNVCKSKIALNLIDISGKMWYKAAVPPSDFAARQFSDRFFHPLPLYFSV